MMTTKKAFNMLAHLPGKVGTRAEAVALLAWYLEIIVAACCMHGRN